MRLEGAVRRLAGMALALGILGTSARASAFCRVTTCDPSEGPCERDENGCLVSGEPLYWASDCVTVAIQSDGSLLHGIDADEVEALAVEALATWRTVDCGGGRAPSIELQSLGQVACNLVEYNEGGNANIVMIRDDDWPYSGSANTLGRTRLAFDPGNGRIYDADIEVNGAEVDLSVGDPVEGADLLSILTHEMGHFLGLDHSLDENATMRFDYEPFGTALRSLGQDDIDGICAVYPPDRTPASTSCEPRHGFSAECGGKQPGGGSSPAASSTGGCRFARASGGEISRFSPWFFVLGLLAMRRNALRSFEGRG